ncbi:hypothetical protein V9T40_000572 [Parthenolecanium corni]|uniref:Uncharacterized protein n=1 Tax=Parthenolecanium corni TaxID=536013 RepID=A0AAN9Y1V4_9HEMI
MSGAPKSVFPEDSDLELDQTDLIGLNETVNESGNTQIENTENPQIQRQNLSLSFLNNTSLVHSPGITPTSAEPSLIVTDEDNIVLEKMNITLPTFTPEKIEVWLKVVKAKLKACGVKDEDLFKKIRTDIPIEIAERIPDICEPTAANDNFEWFSTQLRAVYGRTKEQNIRELLTKLELDEQGPKRLMERMIEKAGTELTPLIIADLFRHALPKELSRLIISLESDTEVKTMDDLKKLADKAEKIFNFEKDITSPKKRIAAVSFTKKESTQYNPPQNEIQTLKKEINDLKSTVGNLKKQFERFSLGMGNFPNPGAQNNFGNFQNQNDGGNRGQNSRNRSSTLCRQWQTTCPKATK